MKAVVIVYIFAALVCSSTIASGQLERGHRCSRVCPYVIDPRCGYNGYCVREFINPCELARANCRNYGAFVQVDLLLCRLAAADPRGRGRLRLC